MSKKRPIPVFEYPLIETHCHLDYLKEKAIDEIVDDAKNVGIQKIITIAVKLDNFQTVIDLTKKYQHVFCTQGVHPHNTKDWDQEIEKQLTANLANPKVLAVGEIGLDFYYNNSPREKQIEAFSRQLQIACDHNLPVVIHSRDADEEMIDLLNLYAPKLKRKGVIHSFTSGQKLAETALSHDFCLGFNGIITFKNADLVREIVELCPLEKILLETDSPFLTPVPYRGQENHPSFLPFVAEKVAEIKKVSIEEVLKTSFLNSKTLFSIPD